MRIAVVGSGISGLAAAHYLQPEHDVQVFEAADRLGGHTATMDVAVGGKQLAVDTGFIVFNDWTYPNFIALMQQLDIASQHTEMSFSVTNPQRDFEYGGTNLLTLFAQRNLLWRPSYYRFLLDILYFNRRAKADFANDRIGPDVLLMDYLHSLRLGKMCIDKYIVPMASAIWSASQHTVADFQALFFVRFFINHGLFNVFKRPQWSVISGGSRQYIEPLTRSYAKQIHLNTRVLKIQRQQDKVILHTQGPSGQAEGEFDQVVLACHSDQALATLAQPSAAEREVLGAIGYQDNKVTLHTDESILPKARAAWSSWNYLLDANTDGAPVLTYYMNLLQSLPTKIPVCVTVNGDQHIDPSKVLGSYNYAHPQLDHHSINAQQRWQHINGVQRTHFAGAYWRNGFHEDGVVSARRVADAIGSISKSEAN